MVSDLTEFTVWVVLAMGAAHIALMNADFIDDYSTIAAYVEKSVLATFVCMTMFFTRTVLKYAYTGNDYKGVVWSLVILISFETALIVLYIRETASEVVRKEYIAVILITLPIVWLHGVLCLPIKKMVKNLVGRTGGLSGRVVSDGNPRETPPAPPAESPKAAAGTLIVTVALTALISAYVSNKVVAYLERERVTIEFVEFKPAMNKMPYGDIGQQMTGLGWNRVFRDWTYSRSSLVQDLFLSRGREALDAKEVKAALFYGGEFLRYVANYLGEVDTFVKSMPNRDRDWIIQGAANLLGYPASALGDLPVEQVRETLGKVTEQTRSEAKVAQTQAGELVGRLGTFAPQRTGSAVIRIVLLNRGNSDGLIKGEGELEIEDMRVPVRIKEGRAVKIEKRSMVETQYELDEASSDTGSISRLKQLIMDGGRVSGRLTILDYRNRPVSYDFQNVLTVSK